MLRYLKNKKIKKYYIKAHNLPIHPFLSIQYNYHLLIFIPLYFPIWPSIHRSIPLVHSNPLHRPFKIVDHANPWYDTGKSIMKGSRGKKQNKKKRKKKQEKDIEKKREKGIEVKLINGHGSREISRGEFDPWKDERTSSSPWNSIQDNGHRFLFRA